MAVYNRIKNGWNLFAQAYKVLIRDHKKLLLLAFWLALIGALLTVFWARIIPDSSITFNMNIFSLKDITTMAGGRGKPLFAFAGFVVALAYVLSPLIKALFYAYFLAYLEGHPESLGQSFRVIMRKKIILWVVIGVGVQLLFSFNSLGFSPNSLWSLFTVFVVLLLLTQEKSILKSLGQSIVIISEVLPELVGGLLLAIVISFIPALVAYASLYFYLYASTIILGVASALSIGIWVTLFFAYILFITVLYAYATGRPTHGFTPELIPSNHKHLEEEQYN